MQYVIIHHDDLTAHSLMTSNKYTPVVIVIVMVRFIVIVIVTFIVRVIIMVIFCKTLPRGVLY